MSMKNSNDTIGNRTRALPVFSAVPQPTAPPRPLIIPCTHGINTYTPETNHVSGVYSVAVIPHVLLMVHIALSSLLLSYYCYYHHHHHYLGQCWMNDY